MKREQVNTVQQISTFHSFR